MVTVSTPSMVPKSAALPDVLPTELLNARGMATRPTRDQYRKISNTRNVVTVAGALTQTFGVVIAASVINTWWAYLIAFLLMGRGHALLNILAHEAAHRILFTKTPLNDFVGRWLLAYPSYQAMLAYRRAHFAHHRDEMGPNEPDMSFYAGYPITKASWHRKLRRDMFGNSAKKNFAALLRAAKAKRTEALQIVGLHIVALGVTIALGRPFAYIIWIASWSSLWRVSNRLRSVAEHGGMTRSKDRRMTSHVIKQSYTARFCIAPYNTGWHLAHHADMAVPWRNLPRFHDELVRSGWITDELEYPSYRAFFKAATSREDGGADSAQPGQAQTESKSVSGAPSSMMNFD